MTKQHNLRPHVRKLILDDIRAQEHTALQKDTKSFFVADLSKADEIYQTWTKNLPNVTPFYALKCNSDAGLVKKLASLGVNFDCASYKEIKLIVDLGISPSRILYTNPIKSPASLIYAREVGVSTVTVDNSDEILKVKQYHPSTKLHIRIIEDDDGATTKFGKKFGVTLGTACHLLEEASELGFEVSGISFHVGTGDSNPKAQRNAIEDASILLDAAKDMGHPVKVLDIGGGFTADSFVQAAFEIREALSHLRREFRDLQVIAEPGRLFADEVFTLATQVIGRRGSDHDEEDRRLYINDGVFGNFMNRIFEKAVYQPVAVVHSGEIRMERGEGNFSYSIWGPTCDSQDGIATKAKFESEVYIGDWLVIEAMGAYTNVCRTGFNGFDTASETFYTS